MCILWTVSTYTLVVFMPVYVQRAFGIASSQAFTAALIGNVFMVITCVLAGAVSDRIGRKRVLIAAAILLLVVPHPLLWLVKAAPGLSTMIFVQSLFCIMAAAVRRGHACGAVRNLPDPGAGDRHVAVLQRGHDGVRRVRPRDPDLVVPGRRRVRAGLVCERRRGLRSGRDRRNATQACLTNGAPRRPGRGDVAVPLVPSLRRTEMSDFDLVVSGRVVLTDRVLEQGYVAIRGGTIERVGEGAGPSASERQDFGSALVLPGAVDSQVHSNSQRGQEGFEWSSRAARGGRRHHHRRHAVRRRQHDLHRRAPRRQGGRRRPRIAGRLRAVRNDPAGRRHPSTSTRWSRPALRRSSSRPTRRIRSAFRAFPTPLLHDVFAAVARHGLMAGVHNENDECARAFGSKVAASGQTDYRAHGLSRPPVTETLAIAEVYELAAATGCSAHIVHCSVGRGYTLAAAYRAQGVDATIEACIHYLTLCEEDDVSRLCGKAKINPPIRGGRRSRSRRSSKSSSFYPRPRAAGDESVSLNADVERLFLSAPACGGRRECFPKRRR